MNQMKNFLLVSLLIVIFSFTFTGCYTQLAYLSEQEYSAVEPSPIILIQHEDVSIYTSVPYYPQQPAPPVILLPTAGSISTGTSSQTSSQARDTGYQRPDQSSSPQSANTATNSRPIGSTRGGR